MKTYSRNAQEEHTHSIKGNSPVGNNGPAGFELVDNRPEAAAQRRLQATISNSSNGALLQRRVAHARFMQQVAGDNDLWNLYAALNGGDRATFRGYLPEWANRYAAVLNMVRTEVRNWYAANALAVMAGAPSLVTEGGQNNAHYRYHKLARIRWHNIAGPNGSTIRTLGINLHRGPVYSDEGSAWVKMTDDFTVEIQAGSLIAQGALTAVLEPHAAAVNLDDNGNLPP